MTANSARGAEGKACKDADDSDDGEKFDQGEGRLLTQRSQRTERIVFCEVNIRGDLSGSRSCGMSWIFVLVERGESGCSHRYDLNFISPISKGKKQFVHVGGVAGGDFDHWDASGVGFAGDQRGDSGGEESGGGGDGGIDQDGGQRILCGVFGVSIQ